jgi:hypothetical protein
MLACPSRHSASGQEPSRCHIATVLAVALSHRDGSGRPGAASGRAPEGRGGTRTAADRAGRLTQVLGARLRRELRLSWHVSRIVALPHCDGRDRPRPGAQVVQGAQGARVPGVPGGPGGCGGRAGAGEGRTVMTGVPPDAGLRARYAASSGRPGVTPSCGCRPAMRRTAAGVTRGADTAPDIPASILRRALTGAMPQRDGSRLPAQ